MGGVVTEEQEIIRAQYLDLVYSHFNTLYDLIPNSPHPSNDPSRPTLESHVDGMIGSVKEQFATQSTRKQGHPTFSLASSQTITNTKYVPLLHNPLR
jgi:hypothetical protein